MNPDTFTIDNPPTMADQKKLPPLVAVRWQAWHLLTGSRRYLTSSQAKLDKYPGINVGLMGAPAREALPTMLAWKDAAAWLGSGPVMDGLDMAAATEINRRRYTLPDLTRSWTACSRATAACSFACVGKGGHGRYAAGQIARAGRTLAFQLAPEASARRVARELLSRAMLTDGPIWFRGCVSDDQPGRSAAIIAAARSIAPGIADRIHPYDYTAIPAALDRDDGVTRCLSHKGTARNRAECRRALDAGHRLAVVFDIGRDDPKPARFMGAKVQDGDQHDVWPLLSEPGDVIGLYLKGHREEKERARRSGFAVPVTDPRVSA